MNHVTITDEQAAALWAATGVVDQPEARRYSDADLGRSVFESPAMQSLLRSVQAQTLRDAVEGFTVIATGKILPRDLLEHADWLDGEVRDA